MSGYVMPEEMLGAVNLSLTFVRQAFPYISKAFAISHNNGIEAEFNGVSVTADSVGEAMSVTIKSGDSTRITFVAATENPHGRFHDPSVSICHGTLGDLTLMVSHVVEGIRSAEQGGTKVFREHPVRSRVFGG